MDDTTNNDWIKPGADIVVYWETYRGNKSPRLLKVSRVATKSFLVEGITDRFSLENLETKRSGSWSTSGHYVAIHPDSDMARAVLDEHRRERLVTVAWAAVEKWQRDSTRENRLMAIEALSKVED